MQDTRAYGTFTKVDDDRRLAFGWAYVTEDDGQVAVDHSGDFIDKAALPALEDAAYEYVLNSREADEMHVKLTEVAQLVESVMLTPDKAAAMGITTKRYGYWVGFKVQDDVVWGKIKDGTYGGFSIRGTGEREAAEVEKYDPSQPRDAGGEGGGQWTDGGGSGGGTVNIGGRQVSVHRGPSGR